MTGIDHHYYAPNCQMPRAVEDQTPTDFDGYCGVCPPLPEKDNPSVFQTTSIPPDKVPKLPDPVNHPQHYGGADNPYEAIKVIHAWELGFDLGNTVKYISRAGKKDPAKEIEDLKKAQFYLNHHIADLETKQ